MNKKIIKWFLATTQLQSRPYFNLHTLLAGFEKGSFCFVSQIFSFFSCCFLVFEFFVSFRLVSFLNIFRFFQTLLYFFRFVSQIFSFRFILILGSWFLFSFRFVSEFFSIFRFVSYRFSNPGYYSVFMVFWLSCSRVQSFAGLFTRGHIINSAIYLKKKINCLIF
jgi:hypothetical protein